MISLSGSDPERAAAAAGSGSSSSIKSKKFMVASPLILPSLSSLVLCKLNRRNAVQ
jgi:hypothetical protein